MVTPADPRAEDDRVEALLSQLSDMRYRRLATERVSSLLVLYGAGMERMLDLACREDGSTAWLFSRWGN